MADESSTARTERLEFADFVAQLAEPVGSKPVVQEKSAVWEREPYQAILTDEANGALRLTLLTSGKVCDESGSAALPELVNFIASIIRGWLDGPRPPRPEPKKLPVDEMRIEAIQGRFRRVQQQVHWLMDHRRWNLVYAQIICRNPTLADYNNPMVRHLHRVYLDYAVLAIRRQAKLDKDAYTLIGVMQDVRDAAASMTREWYQRLWKGQTKSKHAQLGVSGPTVGWRADQIFEEFADSSGERVDPAIIERDITEFQRATAAIVEYADKVTAHDDPKGVDLDKYAPEQRDIDESILALERFSRRYSELLFGLTPDTMTPVLVGDPLSVFRQPWIQNDADAEVISTASELNVRRPRRS